MSNILTVYFSHRGENYFPDGIKFINKGNTEYAAEYVHKAVGGELFRIETEIPYPENYNACGDVIMAEIKSKARPALKAWLEDVSMYDTIFVCYPNWCGTLPLCVLSFLERYDLSGKKLVPLCTNEGSGLAKSPADLQNSCPGAIIAEGLSVRGHKAESSEEEIAAWAKQNL